MPNGAKKICAGAGCYRILEYGIRHCPECAEKYRTRRRMTTDTRPSSSARGYDHRWEQASLAYRAEHPLCVECEKEGVVKAAECVDHIIPHEGDATLLWSETNWQSLCGVHHRKKTAREREQKRKRM